MKKIILCSAALMEVFFSFSQNVGIGTTSPAAFSKLHVKMPGTGNFDNIMVESPAGTVGFGLIYRNPTIDWFEGPNFGNFNDGRFRITNSFLSSMGTTWFPDGRFAVGNFGAINPLALMEVRSSRKNSLAVYTDSTQSSLPINTYYNGPAAIRGEYRGITTNDGSGVVGIAISGSAVYGIGVTGTGRWHGVMGVGQPGAISGLGGYPNGAAYAIYSEGTFYLNGDFQGSGINTYTSDAKLKKDIRPVEHALALIEKLKPSTYEFRIGEFGSMRLSPGKHYGVVAQDLQEVLPELVVKQKFIPSNKEEKGFDYLGVNYNELIPLLIKGMQEQQETINALKARLAKLEKK